MNHSLFENCSYHYPNEPSFENCTLTTAPCVLIQDLNTAISVNFYAYYVTISLFSVAALANCYCLCITVPLFFEMEEESKKRYIFLLTRCLSCICMVFSMILTTSVFEQILTPSSSNFFIYAPLAIASTTCMFGLLGSYVGLALLLYIGVMYPMIFKTQISLRLVYLMVSSIYLVSLLISIPIGIFQAAIQSPGGLINCTQKTCVPWVNLIEFIISGICLVFTIAILFFVFISLVRHNQKLKRTDTLSSSASSMKRVRRRLGWAIIAVIFISAAQIIPYLYLLDVAPHDVDTCNGFYRSNKFMGEVIAGFAESLVWIFVFLFDPIANIFCDKKMSEKVKNQFKTLNDRMPNAALASSLVPR
ncbi:hypothetical protein GCK72_010620 [Caenorhabditis remanei]|uniref:G-protein coupled receptors family 1 profile domain-containing protein n=1 Tax=Caenorhabditis remanei TaxID=31234 RepID=A0A6A5H3T1_CAERE|nr:hypothetical protein GCK72_010620 [Caenorhabditis remanei]KAF1762358.1 hypothetical protein GCK72_010620 [Caenorhabditis remanei]